MGVMPLHIVPMPRAHAEFFETVIVAFLLVSLWITGEFEVQLPIILAQTEVLCWRHAMRWAVGQDLLMFCENLAGPWSYSENELYQKRSFIAPCLEQV